MSEQYLHALSGQTVIRLRRLPAIAYRAYEHSPYLLALDLSSEDAGSIYLDVYKAAPRFSRVREPGDEPGITIAATVLASCVAIDGIVGEP